MKKPNKTPTVVITGANGFIGSALVEHFKAKGWKVRALVVDPTHESKKEKVAYFAYSLASPPDAQAFSNADYLVHTAYSKHDAKTPNAYKLNIIAAKRLVALAKKHNLKKSLFMSSMSAQSDALSVYGKQKYAIEKIFSGQRGVVLRSGLVLGNGGLAWQIAQFIKSKRVAPLIDGGNQPIQVIAIYDLVQAIEHSLVSKVHGTFTIATPTVYSYKKLYKAIAAHLKIKVLFIPVPFIVPLLAIRAIHLLHLPFAIIEDNLLGLKKLRAYTGIGKDLQALNIQPDELPAILSKIKFTDRMA